MNELQHQELMLAAEKHKSKIMINDIEKLLKWCYFINRYGIDEEIADELQHIKIKYDIKKEV